MIGRLTSEAALSEVFRQGFRVYNRGCKKSEINADLFLAVRLNMGLHCLLSIASGMNRMAGRDVSMVCRRFVVSSLVMLGGFSVVMRRMREVF
jgi:hypothetical protein